MPLTRAARQDTAFTNELRNRWRKLSAGDVAACHGDRDRLVSTLQRMYGMTRGEAELQVGDVETRIDGDD